MALISNGQIVQTACINVGGRLVGIDENFRIWRLEKPAKLLMDQLGMKYELGDIITDEDVQKIAEALADALVEVMKGKPHSEIAKELMMTDPLNLAIQVHEISFSGGVAELIYGDKKFYNDIAGYLADKIKAKAHKLRGTLVEPPNKIRATVIGAGAFSLSVSGSTAYFDENIELPIKNLPVVHVNVDRNNLSERHAIETVKQAIKKYDVELGEESLAFYFREPVHYQYDMVRTFAFGIAEALHPMIEKKTAGCAYF